MAVMVPRVVAMAALVEMAVQAVWPVTVALEALAVMQDWAVRVAQRGAAEQAATVVTVALALQQF